MTPGLRWPAAIVCTGALVAALAAVGMDGPVRVLATLFFLLVCTGMAYVPLMRIVSPIQEATLAVTVSLAIDAVVTSLLLAAGRLTPATGLAALGAVCLVGCAAQVRAWSRAQRVST